MRRVLDSKYPASIRTLSANSGLEVSIARSAATNSSILPSSNSRSRIADGVALLVPSGLREHTAQFGFARVGGLPVNLALPAHGFLFHHGYAGSVHLRIQNRNRFSHDNRQVQLHGPLNLGLLARGDIFSHRLCRALYGLGGHLQIGP